MIVLRKLVLVFLMLVPVVGVAQFEDSPPTRLSTLINEADKIFVGVVTSSKLVKLNNHPDEAVADVNLWIPEDFFLKGRPSRPPSIIPGKYLLSLRVHALPEKGDVVFWFLKSPDEENITYSVGRGSGYFDVKMTDKDKGDFAFSWGTALVRGEVTNLVQNAGLWVGENDLWKVAPRAEIEAEMRRSATSALERISPTMGMTVDPAYFETLLNRGSKADSRGREGLPLGLLLSVVKVRLSNK